MIITWVFLYLQINFRGQNSMDELLDRNKRTLSNFITITQVAVAVAAMQFDFTSVLYYYKLVYTIDTYSWTPDAVKLLFSLTPVLSLLLGIIFFFVYFGMTCGVSSMVWSGFLGQYLPEPCLIKGLVMW